MKIPFHIQLSWQAIKTAWDYVRGGNSKIVEDKRPHFYICGEKFYLHGDVQNSRQNEDSKKLSS